MNLKEINVNREFAECIDLDMSSELAFEIELNEQTILNYLDEEFDSYTFERLYKNGGIKSYSFYQRNVVYSSASEEKAHTYYPKLCR